jgi:uncharacterized membrane protein YcaP (DUF421 family)
MWQNLFDFNISPLNLIVRAVFVYLAVLILLRISGKRQMGQMGPTEFVAILLISNAVQNSMNGGDNSLIGGLLLATILVGLSSLISYLTYKRRIFSRIFEGTPSLLVHKGKVITKNLAIERMTESELRTLLRKQGIHLISEIETAILEADGTLSVAKINDHAEQIGRI